MMRKIFVFGLGTIVLSPIFVCVLSNSFWLIVFAVLYGCILYVSGKSTKIGRFWKEFWNIQEEISTAFEERMKVRE